MNFKGIFTKFMLISNTTSHGLKIGKNKLFFKNMQKMVGISIVLCILFVFSANFSMASTPNYDMTNLINEETTNGQTDIGDLLFVYADYTPEQHVMTNITNITVQRFDSLFWSSTKSIKIIPPVGDEKVLVNGNTYNFDYQGVYTIQSNINASEFSIINSLQENENRLNIKLLKEPSGFNVSFDPSTFLLTDEQSVNIKANIDDDIEPGDYEIIYQIKDAGKIINQTQTIKVLENVNWSITNSTLKNKTMKTGDSNYLGFVDLINTGNTDVEITTSKTGNNSYLIGIPQPQKLYKKSNLRLNFQIQVPSIQESGDYDLEINISGGDIEKIIPITLTVQDSLIPVIESIDFETDKVFKDNEIQVVATDNNDVKRVVLKYDDKNITLLKDGNLFKTRQKFTKLSRYVFNFCAYDEVNNSACKTINKTFLKDDVVNVYKPSITLPTKKIGKYSKIAIFNISKKIDEGVIVQLVELNSQIQGNDTLKVRIVSEDGTVKSFSEYENQVKITGTGEISLEVRSEFVSDFDGILRIILPEYVEDVEDISFKVSYKDYDVPEDFTMPWFDDRTVTCKVKDTGDLDTSVYQCNLEFPIDVKKEDLSFPTTAREKDKLDTDVSAVQEELSKSKKRSGTIITLLIMILIAGAGFAYYFLEIYPYVRRLAKIKEK